MNVKEALELRKALQLFLATLDADTDAENILSVASVFPAYEVGKAYKTKQVFSYGVNGVGDPQLYQVLQDHTSSAEWTPDTATSLYKAIGVTSSGYPEWVQPLGASDAYNTGDIVSYNGTLYKSIIDGNVWSPDVYPAGWELVESGGGTEPEPEPEPDPGTEPEEPTTYPEWVQPTGAHDAYNTGDRVVYNGKVYESTMHGNTWSPDAYPQGWTEVTV